MKTYKQFVEDHPLNEAVRKPRTPSNMHMAHEFDDEGGGQWWVVLKKGYSYGGQHEFGETTKKAALETLKGCHKCYPDCDRCFNQETGETHPDEPRISMAHLNVKSHLPK